MLSILVGSCFLPLEVRLINLGLLAGVLFQGLAGDRLILRRLLSREGGVNLNAFIISLPAVHFILQGIVPVLAMLLSLP